MRRRHKGLAMVVTTLLTAAGSPPALAFYHEIAAPPAATEPAAGDALEVILDEWRVQLPAARVAPGRIVFRLVNAGRFPHALTLRREDGGFTATSITLAGGQQGEFAVELPAGTYRLEAYCPIPGHREQGMTTTLEVG